MGRARIVLTSVAGLKGKNVAEVVDITLPAPRDQIQTKRLEEFARHREHLLGLVMSR